MAEENKGSVRPVTPHERGAAILKATREKECEWCAKGYPLMPVTERVHCVPPSEEFPLGVVRCAPSAETLIARLTTELEEERKRLDWLQSQGDIFSIHIDPDLEGHLSIAVGYGESIRTAIDAAIAASRNKGEE